MRSTPSAISDSVRCPIASCCAATISSICRRVCSIVVFCRFLELLLGPFRVRRAPARDSCQATGWMPLRWKLPHLFAADRLLLRGDHLIELLARLLNRCSRRFFELRPGPLGVHTLLGQANAQRPKRCLCPGSYLIQERPQARLRSAKSFSVLASASCDASLSFFSSLADDPASIASNPSRHLRDVASASACDRCIIWIRTSCAFLLEVFLPFLDVSLRSLGDASTCSEGTVASLSAITRPTTSSTL